MPLVQPKHYTFHEAVQLIDAALPDDDAIQELASAAADGQIRTWIIEDQGREKTIPCDVWRRRHNWRYQNSFNGKKGTMRWVPSPHLDQPYAVEGPIHVDREELDSLLQSIPSPQTLTTAKGISQCREWLKNLTRGEKEKTKDDYRAEAISQFKIARYAFDQIWAEVAPPKWRDAGRPKSGG